MLSPQQKKTIITPKRRHCIKRLQDFYNGSAVQIP